MVRKSHCRRRTGIENGRKTTRWWVTSAVQACQTSCSTDTLKHNRYHQSATLNGVTPNLRKAKYLLCILWFKWVSGIRIFTWCHVNAGFSGVLTFPMQSRTSRKWALNLLIWFSSETSKKPFVGYYIHGSTVASTNTKLNSSHLH